jgi:hypothetical protein
MPEIGAEALFHQAPGARVERRARAAQDLIHQRRRRLRALAARHGRHGGRPPPRSGGRLDGRGA